MRSIEWWYFQWLWRIPNPVFKVTAFSKSNISKTVHYWRTLIGNYTIYQMVPLSMTLSDLWPRFQVHNIFGHWISQKRHEIDLWPDFKVTTFFDIEYLRNATNGVCINRREPPKLGSAGPPPPCGREVANWVLFLLWSWKWPKYSCHNRKHNWWFSCQSSYVLTWNKTLDFFYSFHITLYIHPSPNIWR